MDIPSNDRIETEASKNSPSKNSRAISRFAFDGAHAAGHYSKNQIMAAEIHDRFRISNIRAMRIGLVRLERIGDRRYIANEPQAETDVFRPLFAMNTIAY